MPPQVTKTSGGTTVQQPVTPEEQKETKATSSSTTTKEAKASETAKAEPKKPQEDPKAAAKSHKSSQQHATEKRSHQKLQEQMTQQGLWQTMKNVANAVAVESINKTARVVDAATATAKMMDGANKANEMIRKGFEKTRDIARGRDIVGEVIRVGSTKVSFAEKEAMIKEIYDYRQHATDAELKDSPIFHQEKLKPPGTEVIKFGVLEIERKKTFQEVNKLDPKENRMTGGLTNILGPYGYHDTADPQKKIEILDTALHNWKITNEVDRATIHMRGGTGFIPNKDWKTPPDTRMFDRAHEAKQEVANPALPYNYGKDYFGPRGSEPDIDMVQGQAIKNFTDVANSINASAGPVSKAPVAEPAPPKASPKPTLLLQTAPSRTSGQAKGGGPLDKTQPSAAYEPTVQKQNMAYEPPSDTGPKRPPQNTQPGNPPPPPQNVRDPGRTGPSEPNGRPKGYTLPEAMYSGKNPISQRGAGPPPEIPWLSQKSGIRLNAEQIHEINNIDSSRITWTMNPIEHARQWDLAKSKYPNDTSPAPIAFTTGDGKVVVNMERWERNEVPLWGRKTTQE